jgi:hypothetical protein
MAKSGNHFARYCQRQSSTANQMTSFSFNGAPSSHRSGLSVSPKPADGADFFYFFLKKSSSLSSFIRRNENKSRPIQSVSKKEGVVSEVISRPLAACRCGQDFCLLNLYSPLINKRPKRI